MEATVQTHLRLHRLSVVDVVNMFVVVQVAGLTLDSVPGWMFTLARGHGPSKPGEPFWRARLGRMTAGARRLAAGGLHDPTDVVIQDALWILLMGVSHESTAVVNVDQALGVML